MRMTQVFLVTLVVAMTVSTSSAFAWGCVAHGWHAEGWSRGFAFRGQAVNVALAECGARGPGCHITRCWF